MADTRKPYLIRYTDRHDPGASAMTTTLRAYSAQDAEERFTESDDEREWTVLGVKLARNQEGGR